MNETPPVWILLNPHARGGRGRGLWSSLQPSLAKELAIRSVVETDIHGEWKTKITEAVRSGSRFFVAAGGDGTVKALVNALYQAKGDLPLSDFTLGAVGLGSSNDFHKPFQEVHSGAPLKTDFRKRELRDLGSAQVTYQGVTRSDLFVISASVGLVAEANAFFNHGDLFAKTLKRLWTDGAIFYAALRTLLGYTDRKANLQSRQEPHRPASVTSLSVMKTPFLSGSFRFDTPVLPNDGLFVVNSLEGMTRLEVLRAMFDLARGRFLGVPKRSSWRTPEFEVELATPSALELDGEVCVADRVTFKILDERIQVCR